MSDHETISVVRSAIMNARTHAAIFGSLPHGTLDERQRHLKRCYARLVRSVHPDHAPVALAKEAAEVFIMLTKARDAAAAAIANNTYDQGVVVSGDVATHELVSRSARYEFGDVPAFRGDLSNIYRGKVVGTNEAVLVKIATLPPHNPWLERELLVLERISKDAKVARFVPTVVDSFVAPAGGGTAHRVIVMRDRPSMVSIEQVIAAYPDGLDPLDAAWMARRVLAQPALAHKCGVVHGAIVPAHILVDPVNREPLHIGWAHAVDGGDNARVTAVIERYRTWYPSEVLAKQVVDQRTDIAMAARTVIALFCGAPDYRSLPKRLPRELLGLLTKCTHDSPKARPHDAASVLDEFTRIIRATWGRTYRPFRLPV